MNLLSKHLGALATGVAMSVLVAGAALADPAVLYDRGGQFDKGFNESAYNGAEMYKKETGGNYADFQAVDDASREQVLRQFAQKGYSPIVVPGYSWADPLKVVAAEFPDLHFTIIDSVVDLPNVRSVLFKEQEGSYLVGILAAMKSESGTIGVVPAFAMDLLDAFACGYKQGAAAAKPGIKVIETYIGTGFDAFLDVGKATEVAKSQLDQGADVIFAVAGGAGNGVLDATNDAGKYGIGVDSNQNYIHPGHVLSSMQKRVDLATYNSFMDEKNGKFTAGTQILGLAEGGVAAAMDENNAPLITPEMQAAVDDAAKKIASGEIKVHDFREDKTCPV